MYDNIMQLYNNKTINIIKFLIKLGYYDDRLKDILYRNIKKNIKTIGEITFRDENMNFIIGFENTFNSLTLNELDLNYLSSKELVAKDCKWYENKVNGFKYRYTPDYIEYIDQINYSINQIKQNDQNLYNQLSSQYDVLTQQQIDQFNSNLNSFTKSIKKDITTIENLYYDYKISGNKEYINDIENEFTIMSETTKAFINNTYSSLDIIIGNSSLSEEDKQYIYSELKRNTDNNQNLLKNLIEEIDDQLEKLLSGSYSTLKIQVYELGSYIKSNYPKHNLECTFHPQLRKFFRLGYKENKCINDYTFLNSFTLSFDKNIIKISQKNI